MSRCKHCSTAANGPRSQPISVVPIYTPTSGMSSWLFHILFNAWHCLPFSFQPFQWHRTVVSICIPLMSNADECLFVCFIGHLGILFGKETVHFFCLGRFLTEQAQNPRLFSKEIVLLEFERKTATCTPQSPLGATSPPLEWEVLWLWRQTNLSLNPDSASDQCCDPGLGFPMDKMAGIIPASKRTP